MVIRLLGITEMSGALLEIGKTLPNVSYNIFLISVLTLVYDPRAPTVAAVEEEMKILCDKEELSDMREDTKKRKSTFIRSRVRLNVTMP